MYSHPYHMPWLFMSTLFYCYTYWEEILCQVIFPSSTFQFTSLLSYFCITILKELLAYMLLYERKGNELCFCSRKYTFVPPAWLSVIKERMWLNFPRLGFTSTVVYAVQKSFYTSKFFLFLICIFFHLWRMIPSRARRCCLWCFKCPFPSYICAWNLSLWNRK